MIDWAVWEPKMEAFLHQQMADADLAHDVSHILRVVVNAKQLAEIEGARLEVVIPAAWLHDCVAINKADPRVKQASRLSGEAAVQFLSTAGYPAEWLEGIRHAIEAHSYSANIPCETIEAKVVMDADRLESLGAIGIARCLLTGVSFGADLYDPADPFAEQRELNDKRYSVDHFYNKLFKLTDTMQTDAGRAEAARRTEYMRGFLNQLRGEIAPTLGDR